MDHRKLYTWLSAHSYPCVMGVMVDGRPRNKTILSVDHAVSFGDVYPSTTQIVDDDHRASWLAHIESLIPSEPVRDTVISLEDAVKQSTKQIGQPVKNTRKTKSKES